MALVSASEPAFFSRRHFSQFHLILHFCSLCPFLSSSFSSSVVCQLFVCLSFILILILITRAALFVCSINHARASFAFTYFLAVHHCCQHRKPQPHWHQPITERQTPRVNKTASLLQSRQSFFTLFLLALYLSVWFAALCVHSFSLQTNCFLFLLTCVICSFSRVLSCRYHHTCTQIHSAVVGGLPNKTSTTRTETKTEASPPLKECQQHIMHSSSTR